MKQYRVIVLPEVIAEILDDFLYIKSQSKQNAHAWLDKLYDQVYSCKVMSFEHLLDSKGRRNSRLLGNRMPSIVCKLRGARQVFQGIAL